MEGSRFVASLVCDNWRKIEVSKGLLAAIPSKEYLNQASDRILKEFYRKLKDFYQVEKIVRFPIFEDEFKIDTINKMHNVLIAYEFYSVHKITYEKFAEKYSDKSKQLIEKGSKISKERIEEIKQKRKELISKIKQHSLYEKIDFWLSPSATDIAPKGLSSTGNPIMNLPWTFLGFPTLSVPMATINGLPWNMQFTGLQNKDEKLFAACIRLSKKK